MRENRGWMRTAEYSNMLYCQLCGVVKIGKNGRVKYGKVGKPHKHVYEYMDKSSTSMCPNPNQTIFKTVEKNAILAINYLKTK